MADKPRPSAVVVPTFVDGEAPTAAKLNTLGAVIKNVAQSLEYYVGDIWAESWPYHPTDSTKLTISFGRKIDSDAAVSLGIDRWLDIVNLSRLIGPASHLNPLLLDVSEVTEDVPEGVYSFTLGFKPADPSALVFSDVTTFATYQNDAKNVQASGDYYVSTSGIVIVYDITLAGGTVTYQVSPYNQAGGPGYSGGTFNTLPDPAQCASGSGLTISAAALDGSRTLTLPTVTHLYTDMSGTLSTLNSDDPNFGVQLKLPRVLTENFVAGDLIPKGFIYLRNFTTGTLYYKADYYYVSETQVKFANVDISNEIINGDVFYLITVGTDITSSISDLRLKTRHTHDGVYGERPVHVADLAGIFEYGGVGTAPYTESEIPGNYFPQYIHREGWTDGVDAGTNDENVMRGHLAIGASQSLTPGSVGVSPNTSAGSASTLLTASHKVVFLGAQAVGVYPFIRQEDDALVLNGDNPPTSGGKVGTIEATGKYGVRVKESHLVPEYGIASALSDNEYNVMPIGINYNYDTDGGLIFTIDLDTLYGADSAKYRLLSVDIHILPDGDTRYFHQSTSASFGFDYYYNNSNIITINLTGASFGFGQIIGVRGVAWINRYT